MNETYGSKAKYENPHINIITISCVDIITTSGDENQGEWDPQLNVH